MKSLLLLILLAIPFGVFAQDFPERSNRLVNDYSNTLSSSEVNELEGLLVKYDRESSVQIAIVIMKTLDGYPIDDYSVALFNKWNVGQKGSNNGALIFVSVEERKMWITSGYGLESTLTDAMCKRIIENEIKPQFKQGDFAAGLKAGSLAIIQLTKGEYEGKGNGGIEEKVPQVGFFFIIIFIFAIVWLFKAKQARDYSRINHVGFWTAWMLLNAIRQSHGGSFSSFSGGGGGYSGGGGFGGFGGGSSGGGGAGGSW